MLSRLSIDEGACPERPDEFPARENRTFGSRPDACARVFTTGTVVSLSGLGELKGLAETADGGLRKGGPLEKNAYKVPSCAVWSKSGC